MTDHPQKATFKFALLCGGLSLIATILSALTLGIRGLWRGGELGVLFSGVIFAVPVFFGPYLASRRRWLSFTVGLMRSLIAALPLLLIPASFFVGLLGWGDMQEHVIRATLHAIHRDLQAESVQTLIVAGMVVFGAVATGLFLWISISVLTGRWHGRMLVILWTSCALLSGLFWASVLALTGAQAGLVGIGLLLVFAAGFLFAHAVEINATLNGMIPAFRLAISVIVLALGGAGSLVAAKSVPEKRYPHLENGPLWTLDIGSSECRPAWGGPDSSSAPNEIAFGGSETLGMAFPMDPKPLPDNKWEYRSCAFTLDVISGRRIGQLSLGDDRPILEGHGDGTFRIEAGGVWRTYSSNLQPIGEPEKAVQPAEHWTAAHWHEFQADRDGNLWFEGKSGKKLLAKYSAGDGFIHPLGSERVLVISGRQFSLFRADGTQVATERFTREGVDFAALSEDHRRFALSVYLWGVGDPSYLEEETIIVYEAESGAAVAAIPCSPLPMYQSWAALSPDGTLLAVGAQSTLRLFRLPVTTRK